MKIKCNASSNYVRKKLLTHNPQNGFLLVHSVDPVPGTPWHGILAYLNFLLAILRVRYGLVRCGIDSRIVVPATITWISIKLHDSEMG